ncbi:MAG: hypothetical protein GF368_00075 [Candidatus Aenigmarchaeota archaeon]|nr:hypothetical protein [Candidatus Aenigmarchaeota archaeon]
MRNKILLILAILLLVFLSGCTTYEISNVRVEFNDLVTDKEVYHSAETLNITAVVDSNQYLENVTVNIKGINGKLDKSREVNLENGINQISLTNKLPRCNVCGGIREGDYSISFEIIYEDMKLTDEIMVTIKQ